MTDKEFWAELAREKISPEDMLLEIKVEGNQDILESAALRRAMTKKALESGIKIADSEIEEALTQFYADHDLMEEDQIFQWLKEIHLTEENLKQYLKEKLLEARYYEKISSEEMIKKRFNENQPNYARSIFEVCAYPTEGAARETILAVKEKEMDWTGGEKRELTRKEAPEEISAMLFSAEEGEMIGPYETDEETYEIWRVTKKGKAILDEITKKQIKEEIIHETTERFLQKNPLKFLA